MTRFRHAVLLVIMVAGIALIPTQASAATPPRIVALADVVSRPVEVAITTKHLTLIHFEAGEVSMVAVGDPAIVSVTVKGADVLLKALRPSGSTNGFIWQDNRYTQWTFTVRQNGKDARVIIVRDPVARDESSKGTSGSAKTERPTTGTKAAATRPRHSPSGSAAPSAATVAPPSEPSVNSAERHPEIAGGEPRVVCGASASLDLFVKTLNGRQRELFDAFLTGPSLASLQALLVELNGQQRCDLLALLSAPIPPREPNTDILD
jgi:hypothetical protein